MNKIYPIESILLDGNNICLDFINTIHNRNVDRPCDYIINKATWLSWLQRTGLREDSLSNNSLLFDLHQLRMFRALLYRIIKGVTHGNRITKKDIKEFNLYILKLKKTTKFTIENGIPSERIEIDNKNLNGYLMLILKQARELLLYKEIKKIKECDNCGWFFFDKSKNNKRKWCNMKTCGNEVKARRHYHKIKTMTKNTIKK